MAKKLYVGGLSYGTSDASLKEYFSTVGAVVTATIVMDRETGRSKGFGFVEMSTDAEAATAISSLHGKEFEGRTLTVNEAKPRTDRPMGGGNREGGFNRNFRR
jgi:RNA recognition motif-containing protein